MTLELNTLGDPETRDAWRSALVEYFRAHRGELSPDSVDGWSAIRCASSTARTQDRTICADAPSVDDFLTSEAADFFAAVTAGLDGAGVRCERNPRLVRGLDFTATRVRVCDRPARRAGT